VTASIHRRRLRRAAAEVVSVVLVASVVGFAAVAAVALASGQGPGDTWTVPLSLVAAATGALTWPWTRTWLSRTTEQVLRGADLDPQEAVRHLAGRGGQTLDEDDLLAELASALLVATGAERVAVWRSRDGALERSVAVPADTDADPQPLPLDLDVSRALGATGVMGRAGLDMWLPDLSTQVEGDIRGVPITHGPTVLGLLVLVRAPGAPRFGPADDVELAHVGTQLGVVLHNRELDAALRATLADLQRTNVELRASRQRLVATADAERRRIERDLHDGAQQHLVALAVSLRLAEDAIAREPQRVHELLGELSIELKDAMAELRTLAHGIYPPLLKDSGLVEALRVAVGRSPVTVTTTHERVGRYGSEIEAAVYFCCLEALQNAAKHAPGRDVRIDLRDDGQVLTAVVEDDGPGLDPDAVRPGHGLGNMADRLGAVGGSLGVGRGDRGGARITVEVPVGTEQRR
jgi:signal transduction histidine kinase